MVCIARPCALAKEWGLNLESSAEHALETEKWKLTKETSSCSRGLLQGHALICGLHWENANVVALARHLLDGIKPLFKYKYVYSFLFRFLSPVSFSQLTFCLTANPSTMSSKVHQQATTLKKPKDSKRTSAPPSQCMGIISSFPIIQEAPKHGKSSSTEATLSARRQKSSELKFKIESIGTQLEEDDDLDMCPARTRSSWPHQIVPWWKPSHPREKPPYSYATLIAHAILSSKDGRLTLSDIYKWISEHYPYYVLGQHGWQVNIHMQKSVIFGAIVSDVYTPMDPIEFHPS